MNDDLRKAIARVRLHRNGRSLQEIYGRIGFGYAFTKDLKMIAHAMIDDIDDKDDFK